ncbi:MAG: hypothetical protein TE42_03370 [Candidatus Synechococcus spongiarum SP3]|uniref:Uncharacterized protein n=1 Tax=Candidatus Synechococcus spongiarum SP3 TaxID=1604020 RepID=A0A0G2J583_9SYNE|nr:MAG: hypothetical protein TE42_03370 [Candidatus Synechococcus spongiarum SP3]
MGRSEDLQGPLALLAQRQQPGLITLAIQTGHPSHSGSSETCRRQTLFHSSLQNCLMGMALATQAQPEHRWMPVGRRSGGGAMADVQPGLTRGQRVCRLQAYGCSRGAPGPGATLLNQSHALSPSKGFHQLIPSPQAPLPAQAGAETIQSQQPGTTAIAATPHFSTAEGCHGRRPLVPMPPMAPQQGDHMPAAALQKQYGWISMFVLEQGSKAAEQGAAGHGSHQELQPGPAGGQEVGQAAGKTGHPTPVCGSDKGSRGRHLVQEATVP